MTLRNLEVYLKVIDAGSMRAAAQALYISQPSVSDAVAQLEQEYGVRLFERLGRKLYLTEAGRLMEDYARQLTHLSGEVATRMHDLSTAGQIAVGATVSVGSSVLCNILETLPPAHVVVANSRAIEQLLLKSGLDIALVEGTVQNARLASEPVINDELVLALPVDHPLAALKKVPLKRLEQAPFILREEGSATRALFEQTLAGAGVRVRPVWECNTPQAILHAVESGQGLSVLSARLVAEHVKSGQLAARRLTGCTLRRKFSLVWHRDKYLTAPLTDFMQACRLYEKTEPADARLSDRMLEKGACVGVPMQEEDPIHGGRGT